MHEIRKYSDIHAEKNVSFNENRVGFLIIAGVIMIYHLLVFETGIMTRLPQYVSNTFIFVMILPGFFSAIIYAIFIKNLTKMIIAGLLTILFWHVWFLIYGFMTFSIK